MKITIVIPEKGDKACVALCDRIQGLILQGDESCYVCAGGVAIETSDPVRVSLELMAEGIID